MTVDANIAATPITEGLDARDLRGLPLLIPVPRAAELLGISRSAAYRCAASGDLPTTHLGGRVYIVTARLQQLLESA
jgi:excisionase family DNA binding protein